jgi:hypothetical protein
VLPGIVGGIIAPVAILLAGVSWANQSVTQPALRAAFLYNFAKFTEWNSDASPGPLTICILDDAAVQGALSDLVGGSTINGRAVAISRGGRLRACHLLYVGDADRDRAASILDELQGASVLTVSNGHDFVRLGGIVGLFVDEGRMRFVINQAAAHRAGLRLSSRLLQLATILTDDRHDRP